MPEAILFGGCNGAGKTTLAFRLLGKELEIHEFVNADEIARGLNPVDPEPQAGLASRLMIQRVEALIKQSRSFAFEGTLAGQWQAKILKRCGEIGYQTRLIYVWLPSPEMAVARVAFRVQQGGHNVPEPLIRRRYAAGLRNFFNLYAPLADELIVVDGSGFHQAVNERLIFHKKGKHEQIFQADKWSKLCGTAKMI